MLILLGLICLIVMIGSMAVVAVSVNEFAKKMEEFRQVLESRYVLEPIVKIKANQKKTKAAESASPLEAMLKQTQDNLTKKS
jgi:biopolymer transport protein ExbB/TolQ